MVLAAAEANEARKFATRRMGPALVFERLWEETNCRAVIAELAGKRKHGFALERGVFLTVLHRIFISGSDRAADRWRDDCAIAHVDGLELQAFCGCGHGTMTTTTPMNDEATAALPVRRVPGLARGQDDGVARRQSGAMAPFREGSVSRPHSACVRWSAASYSLP